MVMEECNSYHSNPHLIVYTSTGSMEDEEFEEEFELDVRRSSRHVDLQSKLSFSMSLRLTLCLL